VKFKIYEKNSNDVSLAAGDSLIHLFADDTNFVYFWPFFGDCINLSWLGGSILNFG
jgi:hypothetical protein